MILPGRAGTPGVDIELTPHFDWLHHNSYMIRFPRTSNPGHREAVLMSRTRTTAYSSHGSTAADCGPGAVRPGRPHEHRVVRLLPLRQGLRFELLRTLRRPPRLDAVNHIRLGDGRKELSLPAT